MTYKHFVIDTGYLLELYKVPGHSDKDAHAKIRSKFDTAADRNDRFYLPAVVIFETANHIAGVHVGTNRRTLAQRLRDDVVSSISQPSEPFIIVPHLDPTALVALLTKFADEFAVQKLSLTDSSIVTEARRVSVDRHGEPVHIWTRDAATKALEPHKEADPFV